MLPKRCYDVSVMSIASAIAISGMNVAALRLRVSAANIANGHSSGYVPRQVVQVDTGQGTAATVRPLSPNNASAYHSIALSADTDGFAADPNLRLTNEIVQLLVARFDLHANAQVFRADAQAAASLYNRSL